MAEPTKEADHVPIFAADTTVGVDRSRAAIEALLKGYNCRKYISGVDQDAGKAMIQFELQTRLIRFEITWPKTFDGVSSAWRARWSHRRRKNVGEFLLQIERQRWRALYLVLKAKLESVSSEVATFDEEFMPYIVMPNQQTVAQTMVPVIAEAYQTGQMPRLPLGLLPAAEEPSHG